MSMKAFKAKGDAQGSYASGYRSTFHRISSATWLRLGLLKHLVNHNVTDSARLSLEWLVFTASHEHVG